MPQTLACHVPSPKAPPACPNRHAPCLPALTLACPAPARPDHLNTPHQHQTPMQAPTCSGLMSSFPMHRPHLPAAYRRTRRHASYLSAPCLDTTSPTTRLHSTFPASSHAASMSLPCPVCPCTTTVPALPCTFVPACNNTSFTQVAITHCTCQGWPLCCPFHCQPTPRGHPCCMLLHAHSYTPTLSYKRQGERKEKG